MLNDVTGKVTKNNANVHRIDDCTRCNETKTECHCVKSMHFPPFYEKHVK